MDEGALGDSQAATGEPPRTMKAIYHQIDQDTVKHAVALFLAGAGGLTIKEVPKRFTNRDFLDSMINQKVDVTGEFGVAKLAAMVKTMLIHLFAEEMGCNREDAVTNAALVLTASVEQLTRFLRTPES